MAKILLDDESFVEEDRIGITVLHPQGFDKGQGEKSSTVSIIFDLVAVHGLNGHPLETWKHDESGVMWLKDLLPGVLPNVRIMTYGYNANLKNFTEKQDFRQISSKLLSELVDYRRDYDASRRPLVFVCHSLGGIVAKMAMSMACNKEEAKVQESFVGALFLGTPHRGSSLANYAKIVSNVAAAVSPLRAATDLLKLLRKDSPTLRNIHSDFVVRNGKLRFFSFYEEIMTTTVWKYKIMVVEHWSAVLCVHNERVLGQHADHRGIVRYKSLRDRNFRRVLSALTALRDELQTSKSFLTDLDIETKPFGISPANEYGPHHFEIPFLPVLPLHGREKILQDMTNYLIGGSADLTEQRSFAICGLGGIGKTRIALEFALQNRNLFSTGVWLINASSESTMLVDFEQIFYSLTLDESGSKVQATRRWLAKPQNSRWLLIFDHADHTSVSQLAQYFPVSQHGVIIITSRNRNFVGSLTKQGVSIGVLDPQGAASLLLDSAGIDTSSNKDTTSATKIVQDLGYLPLAITQSGSYIRKSSRSLSSYLKILERRQYEMLQYEPSLVDYDGRSVLATWEINFQYLESEMPTASNLLSLFCFMEPGNITESLLSRAFSPRRQWESTGEISMQDPRESGLRPDLIDLFADELAFDQAIDTLLSLSLIDQKKTVDGLRQFSIHPLVQTCASKRMVQSMQNSWRLQAILTICLAFPVHQYLEPQYGNTGRSLFPQVKRAMDDYDVMTKQMTFPHAAKPFLVSMLVSASRFSDTHWKQGAMRRIIDLMSDVDSQHLRLLVLNRQSSLQRMLGETNESYEGLRNYLHHPHDKNLNVYMSVPRDARLNAQRGEITKSYAECLIQKEELEAALSSLQSWRPLNPNSPATMEYLVSHSIKICTARILRFQGDFSVALEHFNELQEDSAEDCMFEGTGWQRMILSNVAELRCELDQCNGAEKPLLSRLNQMTDAERNDTTLGRRLQLSLAEVYLRNQEFHKAEPILKVLEGAYKATGNNDRLNFIDRFRMQCGLARMHHTERNWNSALHYWRTAWDYTAKSEWANTLTGSVALLSKGVVLLKMGNTDEALPVLSDAKQKIALSKHKYWVVGLGSYWFKYVSGQLEEELRNRQVSEHIEHLKLG